MCCGEDMVNKRIEASPEIEANLLSFAQKLNADAAILYKYIDEQDLEGTEILELISKSPVVVNNKNFYSEIIKNNFFSNSLSLQEIVDNFKKGNIDLESKETEKLFNLLKKHIKVLRFCYIAEQDPESKNWDFNYRQRPPKYLIFSDSILQDKYITGQIPHEGATAFFCRAKWKKQNKNKINIPHWHMSRPEINKQTCHSRFSEDPNVYNNYDSHSAAWILLRKNQKNVMGCLRFEYYHNEKRLGSTEYNKKVVAKLVKKVSIPQINELFVSGFTNVLKKQNNKSYEKYYHCLEPLLFEVKKISLLLKKLQSINSNKVFDQLYSIHYLIEHLLYVLKRNTYYGDEILERVSCFISDLLKTLGLHEDIFGEVWSSLRRHEDLMLYRIEKYRDHFMHQFHVFISGYIIIYSYGIEFFQDSLNQLHKRDIIKFYDEEAKKQTTTLTFSKIDVIRVWALAALFHDCGYVFQKLGKGVEEFSEKVLGSKLRAYFFWDDTIFTAKGTNIPTEIEKMCHYFTPCHLSSNFDQLSLFKILLQEGITNNDHGVISAIILLQKHKGDKVGFPDVPLINHLIYIASLAISTHNSNVFMQIKKQGVNKICLRKNPIAFLLSYCDQSQEWGRKRSSIDHNYTAIPHLELFQTPDTKITDHEKNVKITLYYPAGESGQAPNTDEIKEILDIAKETFISPTGNTFEIYYNIRNSTNESFPIPYSTCDKRCQIQE
jgi:hypothetical protein